MSYVSYFRIYTGCTVLDLAEERPELMAIVEKSRTPPVVNGLAKDNLSELGKI